MERSRTTAHDRLSGLRSTVARRRKHRSAPSEVRPKAVEKRTLASVGVPCSTGRVLAITGDPVERIILDERLSVSGEFDVELAENVTAALELAPGRYFDAIAIDVEAAAEQSPETLNELLETSPDAAIVVIGGSNDTAVGLEAIDAGAHEYVPRAQLKGDATLRAVRRSIGRNDRRVELDRLANTDPLTGLLNRRGFEELGTRALEAAERLGSSLTLMLLDIDDLEAINLGYGHSEGDEALRQTARTIVESLRTTDLAARVGDDEFCIALTDGSAPVGTIARAIGRKFDQANAQRSGALLSLTLGVAHSDDWTSPTLWNLVDEADSRMLAAKS